MKAIRYATRIAIVDDHPIVRQGLRGLIELETDMKVCAEFDGSGDIVEKILQLEPDVLILDISLGGKDGISLTRALRRYGSRLPIIILSMHQSKLYISKAIRAGANGYLAKHESSEQMIDAIRQVRQGLLFISGEHSRDISDSVSAYHASQDHLPLSLLSDRERQIFRLIGCGDSTIEIADHLNIRPKTVETYRSRIKEKLEIDSSQRLSMTATCWATRQGLTPSAVS